MNVALSDSVIEAVKAKTGEKGIIVLLNGKQLEKEQTFQEVMMKPDETLFAVSSSIEGVKWFRFPHYI